MRNSERNSTPANGMEQRGTRRAMSWLDEQLARGKWERFCVVHDVDPALATDLLKQNQHNRPIVPAAVAEYAALMQAGMWRLTSEAISIAHNTVLVNGQHRLLAIIKSGCTVPITLWFGVDPEEFKVVDGGRKRTAQQILALEGVPNAALRASLAQIILLMVSAKAPISNQHVVDYARSMEAMGPVGDACTHGHRIYKITSPTAGALAWWHIHQTSPNRAKLERFWDGLSTGENLTGPRLQLREWLMHGDGSHGGGQSKTVKRAAGIVMAWTAWVADRKRVHSFEWPHFTKLPDAR